MVDTKKEGNPMAREIGSEIAIQTAPATPVNGLPQVDVDPKKSSLQLPFELTSNLKGAVLRSLAAAGLFVSTGFGGIACAEKPAQAGTSPSAPEATAEAFQKENPDATFKTNLPFVTKPEPAPILSPSSEVKKPSIPPEAEQILGNLEVFSTTKPNILNSEEVQTLRKGFEERDWPNANTERKKWGAYSNLYGSLWARYNVTKDETLKAEMSKIEGFMQQTWPSLYPAAVKGGNFLRE